MAKNKKNEDAVSVDGVKQEGGDQPAEYGLEVTNPASSKEQGGVDTTKEVKSDEEVEEEKPQLTIENVGTPALDQFGKPDESKAPEALDPEKAAQEKVEQVKQAEQQS